VVDYAAFIAAIMGRGSFQGVRLLGAASVDLALQPHATYVYPPARRETMDQFHGLNWFVYTDRFRAVRQPFSAGSFYHSGSDGTLAFADPSRNLIIVYATQSRLTDTLAEFARIVHGALLN
jgi:CubicO group peptidase (beta-lactamase class C family)